MGQWCTRAGIGQCSAWTLTHFSLISRVIHTKKQHFNFKQQKCWTWNISFHGKVSHVNMKPNKLVQTISLEHTVYILTLQSYRFLTKCSMACSRYSATTSRTHTCLCSHAWPIKADSHRTKSRVMTIDLLLSVSFCSWDMVLSKSVSEEHYVTVNMTFDLLD